MREVKEVFDGNESWVMERKRENDLLDREKQREEERRGSRERVRRLELDQEKDRTRGIFDRWGKPMIRKWES